MVIVRSSVNISVPRGTSRREINFLEDEATTVANNTEGYDSDGAVGPFFDAVEREMATPDLALMDVADIPLDDDEARVLVEASRVLEGNDTEIIEGETVVAEEVTNGGTPVLTAEMVEGFLVSRLREELGKRGMSKNGNKAALKQRLLVAVAAGAPIRDLADNKIYPNPEDGFCGRAHWVSLEPSSVPVANPTPVGFRAPTNRDGLEEKDLFQFEETFDRPVFQELCKERELAKGQRSYKMDGRGKPKYFEKVRTKGRPKMQW